MTYQPVSPGHGEPHVRAALRATAPTAARLRHWLIGPPRSEPACPMRHQIVGPWRPDDGRKCRLTAGALVIAALVSMHGVMHHGVLGYYIMLLIELCS